MSARVDVARSPSRDDEPLVSKTGELGEGFSPDLALRFHAAGSTVAQLLLAAASWSALATPLCHLYVPAVKSGRDPSRAGQDDSGLAGYPAVAGGLVERGQDLGEIVPSMLTVFQPKRRNTAGRST